MSERTIENAISYIKEMIALSNLGCQGYRSRQDQDNELILAEITTLRAQLAAAQKLAEDRGAEVERLRAVLAPKDPTLVQDAFAETVRRYGAAAEPALVFFATAIAPPGRITEADIAWAKEKIAALKDFEP